MYVIESLEDFIGKIEVEEWDGNSVVNQTENFKVIQLLVKCERFYYHAVTHLLNLSWKESWILRHTQYSGDTARGNVLRSLESPLHVYIC